MGNVRCHFVLWLLIPSISFQAMHAKKIRVPSSNENSTSFLTRVRRVRSAPVITITKTSAAVDKVCTNLVPCRGSEEGEVAEDMLNYCIQYNLIDMETNAQLHNENMEDIESKGKLCYDPDPAANTILHSRMKARVLSKKPPKDLNDGYEGVGFAIPSKSVYRYFPGFNNDIFFVSKHYTEEKEGFVDFDFMEWPGQTMEDLIQQQMAAQPISDANRELGEVRECMQVLEFDGKSNKYLDYLCNTDEGLDIAAVGLLSTSTDPMPENDKPSCPKEKMNLKAEYDQTGNIIWEEEYNRVFNLQCNLPKNRDNLASKCVTWPIPPGKLYLASGNMSLVGEFVQPLLIREDILRRLIQPDELSLDGEKYVPSFGGKKLECSEVKSQDIRTVLDFAFSSDRLILGMKCGVILVKNINQEQLNFDVAYMKITDRQRPRVNETNSHMFPYMINTIAASTCCSTDKMCHLYKPIVAIYSSYAAYFSYPDDKNGIFRTMPKFIYISTDNGDTFDRRVVASPQAELNLMYWMYTKIPKWQVRDARPPDWIKDKVIANELGTDSQEPIDPIINYLLQNVIPKVEDDDDCYEIVSMVVVSEESLLLVLCRYKGPRHRGEEIKPYTYGVFSIKIRGTLPLISTERRSKRKFLCSPVPSTRYWGNQMDTYLIEPTLIRVPNSYSIFVMGCHSVLYYSSNGGRTMFLSSFFVSNTNKDTNETTYERTYVNEKLENVPMIALDSQGQSVMLTYGARFAYGVISTNTDIAFVCGEVLDELLSSIVLPTLIPFLNDAGKVGMALLSALKINDSPIFSAAIIYYNIIKYNDMESRYVDRYAIRLLDCSLSIHEYSLPYYTERNKGKKDGRDTIKPCTTFNFKTNKTAMFLDVGESDAVKVAVFDRRKATPLNILLTHDKAASLIVYDAGDGGGSVNNLLQNHAWVIKVTAKPYIIPRTVAMVNAFFGASYSNLEEVSAHLIVSTEPQMRCHVQPRGHLQVRFGCSKRLVIHEDERRPHCEKFQTNFEYEIPQGHYDEDMANYWIFERPKFYKIVNGTLKITYDYEMFGCPVQPYRLDPYFPDLRILPIGGSSNTTEGELFNGSFVLIEIFGATGYSFNQKVKDQHCKEPPQTLEKMVGEWKVRVEAIKSVWYDYPHFDFDSVYHPLNIWNRVNYVSCHGYQFISEDSDSEEEPVSDEPVDLEADVAESPYEILKREINEDIQNKLIWDPTIRQQLYIFLAVAVDPYGTFCNHHTFFGLSITVPKEGEDWVVIVVFFASLIILILLILAGYYLRRYQVYRHFYKEAMFNHLLTAAWNLSFRYEKMLYDAKITDPEVKKEMEETRQMKNTHSGVEPPAMEKQPKTVDGLRHRLRQ